jgi:hypothetical protein
VYIYLCLMTPELLSFCSVPSGCVQAEMPNRAQINRHIGSQIRRSTPVREGPLGPVIVAGIRIWLARVEPITFWLQAVSPIWAALSLP